MNEHPTPPYTPLSSSEQPASSASHMRVYQTVRLKWPIILMVWPGVGLLLSIALYAAVAFIGSQTTVPSGDLFAEVGPVQIVFNILVFVVGALSVAFGPISFFIGLVLLIVRLGRKNKQQSQRETAAKE